MKVAAFLMACILFQGDKAVNLAQKEAELNAKEAELKRKEAELDRRGATLPPAKNWPSCCPVVHHDIAGEVQSRWSLRIMVYSWGGAISFIASYFTQQDPVYNYPANADFFGSEMTVCISTGGRAWTSTPPGCINVVVAFEVLPLSTSCPPPLNSGELRPSASAPKSPCIF